jgi:membrane peptidoglycan carboxypeptidase
VQRRDAYLLIKKRQFHRNSSSRNAHSFLGGAARVSLVIFSLLISLSLILGGFYYASLTSDLPSIEQLPTLLNRKNGELLQPTVLYDRSGTKLLASIGNDGVTRRFLSVDPDAADHFSPQLIRLTVDELEPAFWSSTGSAPLTDLNQQPQTIAERLVKDLLLNNESESNRTTLRMRLLAYQVVQKYSRTQTLEWFLNSIYLGHLNYGVESAAQVYLHKSAADLDLAESALLVSLMESPALNPIDSPVAALENQQKLLKKLSAAGKITADEYSKAKAKKIALFETSSENGSLYSDYIKLVVAQLNAELGQDRVERGGLVVTTSLDLDLQTQLECSTHSQLIQIESSAYSGIAADSSSCAAANLLPTQSFLWQGKNDLGAGGLVMDPQTGQILAYLSPTLLDGSKQSAKFEIGSLSTPFVALAAFARGTSPASLQWDVPATLPADSAEQSNPDGVFHGPVSVRSALANDYVAPFASLLEQMDSQTVWSLANATGLSSPKQESASATLLFGGGSSSFLEIAQAYATLAAEGNKNGALIAGAGEVEPVVLLTVHSSTGQLLVDHSTPNSQSVLSRSLTYLINNVLSDETARWTSLGHPNVLEIGRTAAVKNGQVSSKDQVWTVGYTPDRLVLTWVGETTIESAASPLDVRMSAGLWHAMIQYSTQSLSANSWAQPADVSTIQVCSPSGMLPTSICPTITNEVFLNGNEPTQADTLYEKLSVNRETGLLATVFTPTEDIEDRVYLNVPSTIREWASAAGLAVPPLGYDAISTVQSNPQVQISSPSLFAPVSGKVAIQGTANLDGFASYQVQVGQGINPQTWQQVGAAGTSAVTDGKLAVWDTTGLDGLYAIRLNVINQSNQISTAVIQVTVDNVPPLIQITYPQKDSVLTLTSSVITLSANVTDQVGVARVEWWLDGKKLGERSQAPFTYLWTPAAGQHKLQIKAFDSAGNSSASEVLNFNVKR